MRSVISCYDVSSIYKIPSMLHKQGLDEIVCRKLDLAAYPADLSMWDRIVDALENPEHEVDIAMVGKYVDLQDSYKRLSEALIHAGIHTRTKVKIHYVDSEQIEAKGTETLEGHGRDPRARRLRQARHRGQDRRGALRAREQGALPGHLPRHADRRHRGRRATCAASRAPTRRSSIPTRRTR